MMCVFVGIWMDAQTYFNTAQWRRFINPHYRPETQPINSHARQDVSALSVSVFNGQWARAKRTKCWRLIRSLAFVVEMMLNTVPQHHEIISTSLRSAMPCRWTACGSHALFGDSLAAPNGGNDDDDDVKYRDPPLVSHYYSALWSRIETGQAALLPDRGLLCGMSNKLNSLVYIVNVSRGV